MALIESSSLSFSGFNTNTYQGELGLEFTPTVDLAGIQITIDSGNDPYDSYLLLKTRVGADVGSSDIIFSDQSFDYEGGTTHQIDKELNAGTTYYIGLWESGSENWTYQYNGSTVPQSTSEFEVTGGYFHNHSSGYNNVDDTADVFSSITALTTLQSPSNLQITNAQTQGELTIDWDSVANAAGYYVYRSEASGTSQSDYTQVADVNSPPFTDKGLEDGERYFYRVSSHD